MQNFWTVPEVVAEIRDKKARHNLDTLPFELKLREPSDEAMKFGESRFCLISFVFFPSLFFCRVQLVSMR